MLDLDGARFDDELEAAKDDAGVSSDADLGADALKELCTTYKRIVKEEAAAGVSAGSTAPAARCHRGGVQLLGQPRARAY